MPAPTRLRRGKPCIPCRDKVAKSTSTTKNKPAEATWTGAKKMPDGSFEYAKTGFEPPPELEGFTRDPENAWRFIPQFLPCKKRIQTQFVKQCGAITVLSICTHSKCELRQGEVKVSDCQGCPLRIE